MKPVVAYGGYAALALSLVLLSSRSAYSGGQASGGLVRLQPTTPGSAQTGHLNINGTAVAGQFQGGGAGVTGVNAAQLGGLPSGAFGAKALANAWTGVNAFANASNSFTGNGAGLSGVDADKLGGILPTSYGLKSGTNNWTGANTFSNGANSFAGDGSALTGLDAANLASGTVPDARLVVAGDLTGPLGANTLSRIQGHPVNAATPTSGQVLGFDGTQWAPQSDGLVLPFGRTIANNFGSAFFVKNTGDGIVGWSTVNRGVSGVYGVQALGEEFGVGVYAQSDAGAALFARAKAGGSSKAGHFVNNINGLEVSIAQTSGDMAILTNGHVWRGSNGIGDWVATPIAYGVVSSAGTILGGTGNFTVVKAATGQYDVTITGETYSNNTFTVTITPVSSLPRMTTVTDPGSAFRVNIWNSAFALTDTQFQFSVFTANPANPG